MKNKIFNSLLIIASIVALVSSIAGAVLGCNYALILLAIPVGAITYFAAKTIKSLKVQKQLK